MQGTHRLRNVVLAGVVGLLAAAAAAGIALSIVNYRRATTWEDRADASEARAQDLGGQLTASEADRAELQVRIDELAAEKAKAEDEQRVTEAQRDTAYYIIGLAEAFSADAGQCVSDLDAVVVAVLNFYPPAYVGALYDQAVASCAVADSSFASFAAAVASL
jgi:hypothetical protein